MATLIDVLEQVRERLHVPQASVQAFEYKVSATIPVALRSVAEQVAESKDTALRGLLQTDFTASLTGGSCLVSALASANGTLVPRSPFFRVHDGTKNGFMVGDRTLLSIEPASDDWFNYTLSGGTFYSNATGATLTVTASFIPADLSKLPNLLTPLLVETIVELLSGVTLADDEKSSLLESFPKGTHRASS